MRTGTWTARGMVAAVGLLLLAAPAARADVATDRAAALLIFPKIVASNASYSEGGGEDFTTDTLIQISNTSDTVAQLHCFYIDATSHCSISGYACDPNESDQCPGAQEQCVPGWTETDFRVTLTPHQPLAWSAATGLAKSDLPLDGAIAQGIGGSSNAGTRVPPVAATSTYGSTFSGILAANLFEGELKCLVIDDQGKPAARNVLTGEASIVSVISLFEIPRQEPSISQYNAVGVQAINGDANGDNVLELGGDSNEYNGCPNVLILDHFFDFAEDPTTIDPVSTELTLVPCNEDLRNQIPGQTPVQFLVFNEFEQRFSTSTPVDCFFNKDLSTIDTNQSQRSIFSVYVAGTLTGQTRIRGVSSGLVGVAQVYRSSLCSAAGTTIKTLTGIVNLHQQGARPTADQIVLP